MSSGVISTLSPATAEHLLRLGDPLLVPPVEDPLFDLRAVDQPGPAQQLQMLPAGRLADPELVRDEQGAHAVPDQVAVALRREMGRWIAQPLPHQQPLLAAQRLEQVHVQHHTTMAGSLLPKQYR